MGSPFLLRVLALLALIIGAAVPAPANETEVRAIFAQAEKLAAAGNQQAAAQQYERAIALAPRAFGPDAVNTATIYNNTGKLYLEMGQPAKAEPLLVESVRIMRARLPADHLDLANAKNTLANAYNMQGQYDKAEPLYLDGLKVREAKLGGSHPLVGQSLVNLATLYTTLGKYAKAEPLYLRNVNIWETAQPVDHASLALALNNLALLYRTMHQNDKAESLLLRSLKIREEKIGKDDRSVGDSLNSLGEFYRELGQYVQAEPLYLRAIAIREARLGRNHPDVAASLNNLAILYLAMGQYAKAEPIQLWSVKIYEATLPADHPELATSVANLGLLYEALREFAKAEPLLERALKIREAKLGPNHPDVATALNYLANLYMISDRREKAEAMYLRSLKIYETAFGPDHPAVTTALSNLANLYMAMHRYSSAQPLYERSLKIFETGKGPDHPDVAQFGLFNLATLDVALGDPARAAERIDRARRIVRRHVARILPALTDQEQLTFLENVDRGILADELSLALHAPGNAKIAELSAGWLANAKALSQASLAERAQLGRDQTDPKLRAIAAELQSVRTRLAGLAMSAAQPNQQAQRQRQIESLAYQEQSLAKQIAAGRGQAATDDPWVTLESIRNAMPDTAVLIDLARIEVRQFAVAKAGEKGEDTADARLGQHYIAWIVPPAGKGDVRTINLGPADKIDAAVAAYQAAIADAQSGKSLKELGEEEAEKALAKPLAELARFVLDPLRNHLDDAQQLIVSPDAALWLVPWAALPMGDGKYAVEQWEIRYAIAARELALDKQRTSPQKPGAPRIFADPDYDLAEREAQVTLNAIFPSTTPTTTPTSLAAAGKPTTQQGAAALRSAAQIGRVERLAGTAAEAANVAPKLKEYAGAEPKSYLEKSAQEAVFKRLASPRVLLVSTHGFFLPDSNVKVADKNSDQGEKKQPQTASVDRQSGALENPLLRCGLLLAGCNQRDKWTGPQLGDGVLTGLEIVGTDLRATELVVLSACETGLGQVNNGEGVAGLRQAFQIAGAKSVVSTLWQIPDRPSAELMTNFFGNLAAGQTKSEALRNAQLTMIKARRERNAAAHPFFWAAWTVTGM